MSFLTDSIIIFSKQKIKITIHINIFLPSNKEECYFEIGILTSAKGESKYECEDKAENENDKKTPIITGSSTIEISLPIKSDEFQFEDLSNRFIENPDYLRLIFNQTSSVNKNKEFKIGKNEVIFGNTDISNNKIALRLGEDRTRDYYFRFRLKKIKKEKLCLEEETTSFVIDPFKRFINVAGFHINNIRNDKNGRLNLEENQISIQEINTFFICDITATLIDSSIPKWSFRLLEDDTWEKYISNDENKIENIQKNIIYQFKEICKGQQELKDFKLFVKTSHINSKRHLIFFGIVVLIAMSANALYGILTQIFSNLVVILTIVSFAVLLYKTSLINLFSTQIKNLRIIKDIVKWR